MGPGLVVDVVPARVVVRKPSVPELTSAASSVHPVKTRASVSKPTAKTPRKRHPVLSAMFIREVLEQKAEHRRKFQGSLTSNAKTGEKMIEEGGGPHACR